MSRLVTAQPTARVDGRPQFYDIKSDDRVQCAVCLQTSDQKAQYGRGEGLVCDPLNSPFDDGCSYTVCKEHIPENSVIFDPVSGQCRSKDGQNVWTEPKVLPGIVQ